jgi:hypothetical protein
MIETPPERIPRGANKDVWLAAEAFAVESYLRGGRADRAGEDLGTAPSTSGRPTVSRAGSNDVALQTPCNHKPSGVFSVTPGDRATLQRRNRP